MNLLPSDLNEFCSNPLFFQGQEDMLQKMLGISTLPWAPVQCNNLNEKMVGDKRVNSRRALMVIVPQPSLNNVRRRNIFSNRIILLQIPHKKDNFADCSFPGKALYHSRFWYNTLTADLGRWILFQKKDIMNYLLLDRLFQGNGGRYFSDTEAAERIGDLEEGFFIRGIKDG